MFWIIICFNSAALFAKLPWKAADQNFLYNYDLSLQAVNSKNDMITGERKIEKIVANGLPASDFQLKTALAVSGATFLTGRISGTCKLEFFEKSATALDQLLTNSRKIN